MDLEASEWQAYERYEVAEAAFFKGLREWGSREQLTALADAVAEAAEDWYARGMKRYFAVSEGEEKDYLNIETEKTEVLSETWRDIARSFHGQLAGGG